MIAKFSMKYRIINIILIIIIFIGVIEKKKFVRDVMNWDTLICAGRLHKPVKIILDNDISGSI